MIFPTHKKVIQYIEENFPADKKIHVLDIGCGTGLIFDALSKRCIASYVGLDINGLYIKKAKEKYTYPNVFFRLYKRNKYPNIKKVDVILCIGVLQYMNEDERQLLFQYMYKWLKKDGIIIMSCSADHILYKIIDVYGYFFPHKFIKKDRLEALIKKEQFTIITNEERGLIIAPFVSSIVCVVADAWDRIFTHTRGELGFWGTWVRSVTSSFIMWEYSLPCNFGYTLFITMKKKYNR